MAQNRTSRIFLILIVVSAIAAAWPAATRWWRDRALPRPDSPQYEQVSRAFYRGLAALEVGLLDSARQEFTRATQAVPEEPASWANLGLTLIRLGEVDAAADPIAHAAQLVPQNADVAMLAGRMEIARGRLDDGLKDLRRAVQLDPGGLRTRYAVAEEVERGELTPAARREARALYDELLTLAPRNTVVLIERARLAAPDDLPMARDSLTRLAPSAAAWPADAREQLNAANAALAAAHTDDAIRSLTRLRNVLARVPAYREDLAALRTPPELIADPLPAFLRLAAPSPAPASPDPAIAFTQVPEPQQETVAAVTVAPMDTKSAPTLIREAATPIDWNRDFRTDLVVANAAGLRLLQQDASGRMIDATSQASAGQRFQCGCFAAWAADIELDGDLDLVVGLLDGPTAVLRNDGDGTWRELQTFASVSAARAFAWGDVDGDADPDVVLVDASGSMHVLLNRQAGEYSRAPAIPDVGPTLAVTIADITGDGRLDVVTLGADARITAHTLTDGKWSTRVLASWNGLDASAGPGAFRLFAADLDNNGALDLLVSSPARAQAWLGDEQIAFAPLNASIAAPIFGIADLNGDGRLDLAGVVSGQPVRFIGKGEKPYHWKNVAAHAQETAGDQRINSFGVGGDVQIRAGLLTQKQVLTGLPAHFGLGERTAVDVARIVWPNGVPQAEFDVGVDDVVVAEQRLKGSCPWVFTWDGHQMVFVTDFLWRSPLGLRINAQDTAGTAQTEDWIRIRGSQLAPRDGTYDVRITAELWETHFFDHVSLLAVDHPSDTEVFVDERFSPMSPQVKAVRAVRMLRPVTNARDDEGRDVTGVVAAADGRYLATFPRGDYQGIAREHAVEFDLGDDLPRNAQLVLIAQGWVYPTDSSINVAIGQRRSSSSRGLMLEAQDASGAWRTIDNDLGFPAGKNKTMVIGLQKVGNAHRLRLRTNLEIYWDALRFATLVNVPIETQRPPMTGAELRYRGFSQTVSPRGEAPETPEYSKVANVAARWRDLEGYYTRFGDVKELLANVDDRYVIMNAGDEMQLRFAALPAVRDGWRRDFVLAGDGWEKDGDYNTGYSTTVTPLPTHARSTYEAASTSLALEDDPVFRRHRADWDVFHTRYVSADRFLQGLDSLRPPPDHRSDSSR
ncbi:MAG TPA: FG-GAP-like repeat-containing protein [Vicinamibacterales bacterium]|nr:FG-GAP-like repeat-containing protein [Vicinamibacterales bacterium]